MSLLDIARRDAKFITTSTEGGFAVEAVLIDQNGVSATINGLHKKTWLNYDNDRATMVDMKLGHFDFAESVLTEAAPTYSIRNSDGEVHMFNHRVTLPDARGTQITYLIKEWYPDETLGLIVCMLADLDDITV